MTQFGDRPNAFEFRHPRWYALIVVITLVAIVVLLAWVLL